MAALDWSQCPVVESIPGKVSGAWVFKGTRLPVATVIENLEDLSVEEVMEQFDVTREQITAIETTVRAVFGFDREMTEHMPQARFTAGRADNFEQAAGLFCDLLNKRLNVTEKHQLIAMLEEVAEPTEAQTESIEVLKRRLGLAAPR